MPVREQVSPNGQGGRVFATTRWSVVLQAGGPTSSGSAAALEQLCRTYWFPLYSFARRSGVPAHDAEDLTQSFFAFLLAKGAIARADRERGRFRTFLLTAFKNFQSNERAHQSAAKRGGGSAPISFDEMEAESCYQQETRGNLSPEKLYDQKWAISLLDRVIQILRSEYTALGKGPLFDALRGVVWGGSQKVGYDLLARQAGISEGAFKVAVFRLRARFKECLRQEVAQTVGSADDIDDELRHLLTVVGT